jgi:hypothetical protein
VSLFSALNGDMLRENFELLSAFNAFYKILSRIYLGSFVILYVYSVLNIFLLIFGEAYMRLKAHIEEGVAIERAVQERRQQERDLELATKYLDSSANWIEDGSTYTETQFIHSLADAITTKLTKKQNGKLKEEQIKSLNELQALSDKLISSYYKKHNEQSKRFVGFGKNETPVLTSTTIVAFEDDEKDSNEDRRSVAAKKRTDSGIPDEDELIFL